MNELNFDNKIELWTLKEIQHMTEFLNSRAGLSSPLERYLSLHLKIKLYNKLYELKERLLTL
jgi:hypothetical protein